MQGHPQAIDEAQVLLRSPTTTLALDTTQAPITSVHLHNTKSWPTTIGEILTGMPVATAMEAAAASEKDTVVVQGTIWQIPATDTMRR